MDPTIAYAVLRPILDMVQLRCTMASKFTVNGENQQVGLHIPPYRITTVELDYLPASSRRYSAVQNVTAQAIGTGIDEKTGEGKTDTRKDKCASLSEVFGMICTVSWTMIARNRLRRT